MSFELIPSGTHIDFLGRRRMYVSISIGLIALGFAAVIWRGGIPMGIDFNGGTEIQLLFDADVTVDGSMIRAVTSEIGLRDAEVVRFGEEGSSEFMIRFKVDSENEPVDGSTASAETEGGDGLIANTRIIELERTIRARIGNFTEQRVEFVGPKVGAELREDGALALLFSALATLVYVAFRFNARFAPGAVVAVIHDLLVTWGILVMAGVDFDLQILAALLAILGYSLNDTIIIYDRIRENMELHTTVDLEELLNASVNQTLSRTVLTSGTTILALLVLYFVGGDVIRPFALAMLIGVFVGTYSSIFIASPMLLVLETRYGNVASRGATKGAGKLGSKKPARA